MQNDSQPNNNNKPNSPSKEPKLSKVRNIGQFVLGEKLGEGTFGIVRLGTHILTGERVAVKILEKQKIIEQADKTRVEREIQILKILRHNNIIHLYAVIQTNSTIYLIMEYASNKELFDYIISKKRLSEMEACQFYQQIVSGIEYLHKLRIAHRDLKPENLLLNSKNELKIVDFGLSNLYKKEELLSTACGSPCYAAPEMINGQQYKGVKVDIWSSGIILYAMLCGFLPFEDSNNEMLYKKIREGKFAIPTFVSDQAKDLLRKILNTDPDNRYSIHQIKAHSWFQSINPTVNININQGLLITVNVIPIDEDIVTKMEEYDYDKREVRVNVLSNKHNHITTTYYLLLKKKIRKGIMSIADLNSQLFNEYIAQQENLFSKYHYSFDEVVLDRAKSKTVISGRVDGDDDDMNSLNKDYCYANAHTEAIEESKVKTKMNESKSQDLETIKNQIKQRKKQYINEKQQAGKSLFIKDTSIKTESNFYKEQYRCNISITPKKQSTKPQSQPLKFTSDKKTIKTHFKHIDYNLRDSNNKTHKHSSSVPAQSNSFMFNKDNKQSQGHSHYHCQRQVQGKSASCKSNNTTKKKIKTIDKTHTNNKANYKSKVKESNDRCITVNITLDESKVSINQINTTLTNMTLKEEQATIAHHKPTELESIQSSNMNFETAETNRITSIETQTQGLNTDKSIKDKVIINQSQPKPSIALSFTDNDISIQRESAIGVGGETITTPKAPTKPINNTKLVSVSKSSYIKKTEPNIKLNHNTHLKSISSSKEPTRLKKLSNTFSLYNPKSKTHTKPLRQNKLKKRSHLSKDNNKFFNTSVSFDKTNEDNLFNSHLEIEDKPEWNTRDKEQNYIQKKSMSKKFNIIQEEDEYSQRKQFKSFKTYFNYKTHIPSMTKMFPKTPQSFIMNTSRNNILKSIDTALINDIRKKNIMLIEDKNNNNKPSIKFQEHNINIRESQTPFDLSCALFNPIAQIKEHIIRKMRYLKIKAKQPVKHPNKYICEKKEIKFELDLCPIHQLKDAYIIKPLRISGNIFYYKELINTTLSHILSL